MARAGRTLVAEHHLAGDFHLALFCGVRRGDRLAHHRDRRRELWRLHRAGADHADAADPERRQRFVRHLLSRSSSARSTSCCPRRSPISRSSLGYVGAAATKSIILGLIILVTARPVRAAPDRSSGVDGRCSSCSPPSPSACSASSSASGPMASRSCRSSRCSSSRR